MPLGVPQGVTSALLGRMRPPVGRRQFCRSPVCNSALILSRIAAHVPLCSIPPLRAVCPLRQTTITKAADKITFVGCCVLPLSLVSVPLSFSLSLWVLACLNAAPRSQSPYKRDRSALIPKKGCPKDAKKKPLNFERPFFL